MARLKPSRTAVRPPHTLVCLRTPFPSLVDTDGCGANHTEMGSERTTYRLVPLASKGGNRRRVQVGRAKAAAQPAQVASSTTDTGTPRAAASPAPTRPT